MDERKKQRARISYLRSTALDVENMIWGVLRYGDKGTINLDAAGSALEQIEKAVARSRLQPEELVHIRDEEGLIEGLKDALKNGAEVLPDEIRDILRRSKTATIADLQKSWGSRLNELQEGFFVGEKALLDVLGGPLEPLEEVESP